MLNSRHRQFLRTYWTRFALAVVFCIVISFLLLWGMFKNGVKEAEADFNDNAKAAISQLQYRLDANKAVISALSGWYHSQMVTNFGELAVFSNQMLEDKPYIYSIQYMESVDLDGRANFEALMREDGYATFSIKEKGESGYLQDAQVRSLYFPVTFIEPLTPNTAGLLGYDAASDEVLSLAVFESIQSGDTVVSPATRLLNGDHVYYLYKAAYKGKVVPISVRERIKQIDGVFAIAVSPQRIVEPLIPAMEKLHTRVALYHRNYSPDDPSSLIYSSSDKLKRNGSFAGLLPEFKFVYDLHGDNSPYVVELSRDVMLADINLAGMLGAVSLFGVVAFLIHKTLKTDLHYNIAADAAQDEIFKEKELAEVTLFSIADGVITTDTNGYIESMNLVASELTGVTPHKAHKKPLHDVLVTRDPQTHEPLTFMKDDRKLDEVGVKGIQRACVLVSSTGTEYTIKSSEAHIRSRDGDVVGNVIVFRDVSKEQEMAQRLAHQARHDELTGLYNRREFEIQLKQSLANSNPDNGTEGAGDVLCYFDLDQFKVVNDTCGHVAGDELLKQITHILHSNVRETDVLARLGGDEFGLIIKNCSLETSKEIASFLHNVIREYRFVWEGKTFDVGASMGLVKISEQIGSSHEVLSAADSACYIAKDKGRNRIFAYTPNDTELTRRYGEMQWVHKIHEAFNSERFLLYRQAVVPLIDKNDPCHYEILIRMREDDGTVTLPMAFIPAAERYNIMPDVDRWVVRTALWMIGYDQNDKASYNINLSGKSLNEEGFLEFLNDILDESGVDPKRICFEVTETAAITNLVSAGGFISSLRKKGCTFALDDFGSGLSSFSYLKNLPVDFLKIDGSFVKDMIDDPVDLAMVSCIAQVGRVMGMKTIAEFVENDEIITKLKELGVDYGQGYGIAKPEEWVLSETTVGRVQS